VVVIDSRKPRDGRALEIIGHYDPLTEPATVKLDGAKVASWMAKGATPSETVAKLMKLAGVGSPADASAAPAAPPVKPARTRKPAAKAAAKAAE
jgi:small subunit ribosomal protein S16